MSGGRGVGSEWAGQFLDSASTIASDGNEPASCSTVTFNHPPPPYSRARSLCFDVVCRTLTAHTTLEITLYDTKAKRDIGSDKIPLYSLLELHQGFRESEHAILRC